MVCADPGAGIFRATGAGRGIAPTRRGDGAGFAGGNAPPILFLVPQKENGPCTVQEKKRFRGERACLIPGKSLPAAWIVRGVGGLGHPLRRFPLPLISSVSGARRTGFPMTTNDKRRGVHAGETDSKDETGARR